jgi:hypothetical protein
MPMCKFSISIERTASCYLQDIVLPPVKIICRIFNEPRQILGNILPKPATGNWIGGSTIVTDVYEDYELILKNVTRNRPK